MNELSFTFDEQMMTICLLANGWTHGWANGEWVGPGMNPDFGGFSTKEAFTRLLLKSNLYGRHFEHGWKRQ